MKVILSTCVYSGLIVCFLLGGNVYSQASNYFQILYDTSAPAVPGLKSDFGYAVYVQYDGKKILVDTGTKAEIMLNNSRVAGVDMQRLDMVVMTHAHHDHTGGLAGILKINPKLPVYVPPGQDFAVSAPHVVTDHLRVTSNIFIIRGHTDVPTAGIYDDLAIVLRSAKGLYVISSCSHSGAGKIIEHARQLLGEDVYYFSGSDRLDSRSSAQTKKFINHVEQQGVQVISPSHCSMSHRVKRDLGSALGERFIDSQLGKKVFIPLL